MRALADTMKNLTSIKLFNCVDLNWKDFVKLVVALPDLEELIIDSCAIGEEEMVVLCAGFQRLKILTLINNEEGLGLCHLTKMGAYIEELKLSIDGEYLNLKMDSFLIGNYPRKELQSLYLKVKDAIEIDWTHYRVYQNLEKFVITYTTQTNLNLTGIGQMTHLKYLKIFDDTTVLQRDAINDANMIEILNSLPNLKILKIGSTIKKRNCLTSKLIKHIIDTKLGLEYIEFRNTHLILSDEFSLLSKTKTLRYISLHTVNITSLGLIKLIRNCKDLRILKLRNNKNISNEVLNTYIKHSLENSSIKHRLILDNEYKNKITRPQQKNIEIIFKEEQKYIFNLGI